MKQAWHQHGITNHKRRQIGRSYLGAQAQCDMFVYPEDDADLKVKLIFGPFAGRMLGEVLEERPGYLAELLAGLSKTGTLYPVLSRVCKRYGWRVGATATQITRGLANVKPKPARGADGRFCRRAAAAAEDSPLAVPARSPKGASA